jgi:hypothetical protein
MLISTYKNLGLWDGVYKITRDYAAAYPNADDLVDKKITAGIALIRLNRYVEAIDYLRSLKAEVSSEQEPEIQFYIGEAYFNAGAAFPENQITVGSQRILFCRTVLRASWPQR